MPKKRQKNNTTTNAMEIFHKEVFAGDPEMLAAFERGRVHAQIAKIIYDLRIEAGLTQKELAVLAGTSHSQISRIEDADYDGHSISTLIKIASVFKGRIRIEVLPARPRAKYLYSPAGKRMEVPEVIA